MSDNQKPPQLELSRVVSLSLKQLEQGLMCLYSDLPPQDQELLDLNPEEWGVLASLLERLMQERRSNNLH
jgi:hypothetical protein